jgi:hypothetical protein
MSRAKNRYLLVGYKTSHNAYEISHGLLRALPFHPTGGAMGKERISFVGAEKFWRRLIF